MFSYIMVCNGPGLCNTAFTRKLSSKIQNFI